MGDPEIRTIYRQMPGKKKSKRPFDMVVSEYFQGNDPLRKKYLESRDKAQ